MNQTMGLAAVIFDFDGVIADTEPLHHRAFCEVVAADGLACDWPTYQEKYMGFDDRDLFKVAYADAGHCIAPHEIDARVKIKAEAFIAITSQGVAPFPGIPVMIHHLADHYPLALCSGALRSDIEPILRQFDLVDVFPVQVTAEDVPRSKPDPACYCLTVDRLAVCHERLFDPAACVAIEDTPTGITAAREAGLRVNAVTHTHPRAALNDAHAVYDTLPELAQALLLNA